MVASIGHITEILKRNNVTVTEIRRQVIALLLEPGMALTQKEIEIALEEMSGSVDRVTLYRTIKVLLKHQVIHKITIDEQTIKYKLAEVHKKSDHPHFHCASCDKLVCMPQIQIEQNILPDGYLMQSSNLVIEGVCAICNTKSKHTK